MKCRETRELLARTGVCQPNSKLGLVLTRAGQRVQPSGENDLRILVAVVAKTNELTGSRISPYDLVALGGRTYFRKTRSGRESVGPIRNYFNREMAEEIRGRRRK